MTENHNLEIWTREGIQETAFSFYCTTCQVSGPDRPAPRSEDPKFGPVPFKEKKKRALRQVHLDFEDHVAGRDPSQRGFSSEQNHPEGIPFPEKERREGRR